MMTLLLLLRIPALLSAWSRRGRVRPPSASEPTFKNERRDSPSQKREEGPRIVSMAGKTPGGRRCRGRIAENIVSRGWSPGNQNPTWLASYSQGGGILARVVDC